MISSFFTNEFTTERLVRVSGKSSYAANTDGVGYVKAMDAEARKINDIQSGEGYILTCDGIIDVIESDRVTIDGIKYAVKGVRTSAWGSIEKTDIVMIKARV